MNIKSMEKCIVCPRNCGVNRVEEQLGYCGATAQIEVSRAALYHWEEPSISGQNGSGAIFFAHCSLQCVYCQNRTISRTKSIGIAVSVEKLAEIMLDLQKKGAHNINLVSATHYAPQVCQAIAIARKQGLNLPMIYNSSGYENPATLELLSGYIDVYLPDFKYFSNYYADLYSHAIDYPETAKEAIAIMLAQTGAPRFSSEGLLVKGTIIRHLMLPTLAGDTAQVLRYIGKRWSEVALVSLMRQYTPFSMEKYPEINRTITEAEYAQATALFSDFGLQGYLQEGTAVGESFIPQFNGEGVV